MIIINRPCQLEKKKKKKLKKGQSCDVLCDEFQFVETAGVFVMGHTSILKFCDSFTLKFCPLSRFVLKNQVDAQWFTLFHIFISIFKFLLVCFFLYICVFICDIKKMNKHWHTWFVSKKNKHRKCRNLNKMSYMDSLNLLSCCRIFAYVLYCVRFLAYLVVG